MADRFRGKPVEIQAFQWKGPDHPPAAWPQWAQESLDISWGVHTLSVMTRHGPTRAYSGDWVIRASDGEVYPCADDKFREKYEPVE